MDVITYACWDQSWFMLVKAAPDDVVYGKPGGNKPFYQSVLA